MLFKWMLDSVWKLRYDKKMLKQTCSSGIFMFLIRVTNLIKTAIFFVDKGVGDWGSPNMDKRWEGGGGGRMWIIKIP